MTTDEIEPIPSGGYRREHIARHPFWQGLNPHFLHFLYECSSMERVGANQPIFQERGHADRFYLLLKGQVALETFVPGKGQVCIQTLGPWDALGWSWLFPPYEWEFSARAVEPCEFLVFGAAGLLERAEENQEFAHDLLKRAFKVVLQRLQATRRKLVEFYGPLN